MTDVNNVVLIGNLVRDLSSDERSFGYTNSGTARANVTIASNRAVKKGNEWIDETSYFDVVIWGKQAENLKPYFTKGQKIGVQGTLKQERWEKDGQKFSRVVINAETVQLLGGKKEGGANKPAQINNGFKEDIPYADEGEIPF